MYQDKRTSRPTLSVDGLSAEGCIGTIKKIVNNLMDISLFGILSMQM